MPALINVKNLQEIKSRGSVLAIGSVKYSDTRQGPKGDLREELTPNQAIAIMKSL